MPDIKESYEVKKLLESDRAGPEALFCYLPVVLTLDEPPTVLPFVYEAGLSTPVSEDSGEGKVLKATPVLMLLRVPSCISQQRTG